jgi:Bax protein
MIKEGIVIGFIIVFAGIFSASNDAVGAPINLAPEEIVENAENNSENEKVRDVPPRTMPDFSRLSGGKLLKTMFFDFLRPVVEAENDRVMSQRRFVKRSYVAFKNGWELNEEHHERLDKIAREYKLRNLTFTNKRDFRDLLMRVDKVPQALALIQAANESAWGTSYFATKGNNLFGQWCFTEGCGMVPRNRSEGATHEVQTFSSVNEAVRAYINNLNTHGAYKHFRNLRYDSRQKGLELEGSHLALGLQKYSSKGMEYVNILRSMIESNKSLLAKAK